MSTAEPLPKPSRIQMRMAWRLMLCLLGHLALLLFLTIYLESSLNSVRLYTPVAHAEELELESLNTIPALLGAMDAERRAFQKIRDPRDLALYSQMRDAVTSNLDSLNTPLVLPSEAEKQRRALVKKWISDIGDVTMTSAKGRIANLDEINTSSRELLDQIRAVTETVRGEMEAQLAGLQAEEASDASGRVTLMWILVGSVTFFTIVLQLALANSIIGPIQNLTGVVRRMQSGDYSARAGLNSGDEIQSLGETFNAMADNIVHTQQELREKNERLSVQQDALRYANANLEQRVDLKTKELEDKNQKLHEAARLKDEFLATLSHELRTPLTPIISCTHLLDTDPKLGPEQRKSVQVIDRNARALSRMIDELLDLSSVMNRKLRLVRERTEMNEWTRATLETIRTDWKKKELVVTFIPNEEPVELEIDPTRLAQVLTNLMTNAIKYTDPRGKIDVHLTSREDGVRLAVTDSGAGLGRQEIGRIFEMFHQSRTPHTQSVGGLGVGLTVARALAELHGGGLLAESDGPGKGATFTLWLPRLTDSREVDFSVPSLTPLPDVVDRRLLRGRRILLVEDSTDTREALERIFQRRACEVVTAASGEEALELVKHMPPEIIISDLGLPGISGFEFMIEVRKHPEWRDVVAVALSGLGREKDIKGATEAGFDAHLLKPVDMAVLDQTLADALQKRAQNKHG
ncbi:MAG: ATP-binding protein [Methylacidiphilales bacterium]|nr:ATP-binding protein [Candidatus Methylacidiphilales bacterium]